MLARQDQPGERRLVAYVVPAGADDEATAAPLPALLRTHLGQRLPDYMLPAAFVLLERLPLTVNGKLDRAALPAPSGLREQHEQDLTPPRTPAEATMAEIWAQVLQLDRVGIHDHFFALGGDSIRSVQVLARARERGLPFSLPQLFQHPTVAGLCEQLQATQAQDAAADLAPFALIAPADRAALPAEVEDAYPLSALQQGMLFHSSANPGSGVYHDLFSFRLSAPYLPDALRQALRDLAAVHPILRTGFELARFSEPLQLVYRRAEPPLEIADLRHLPPAESEAAVRQWYEADRRRGFDWHSAPLLRFQIHLHADSSLQLSLAFHHAVLDGWSVSALLTELIRRYLQIARGSEPALPVPPLAFRTFVANEQAALRSHEHQAFWRDHLAGAEPIRLPQLAARAYEPPDQLPVRHTHTLSADLTAALKRFCQQQGVPLKSVLLAAHMRVLALLGGRDDALGAVVMHGRPDTLGSEHALGLFLQTVPLRLSLRGHTWAGLVQATWQAEQNVQRFAHYPLAHIQRLAGGPLFEILFNFVHFHLYRQIAQIDDIQVLGDGGYERTNVPLGVTFAPDDAGTIDINLAGTSELLGKAQLQQISAYYLRALEALVAHPDQDCLAASLLDPSEQALLTRGWGQTSPGLPPEQRGCIHELFAAQAVRTPNATALVCGDRRLTYAELDRRANGLALLLRRQGVGPEVRVGILAERSPEQIIALLAVLKAGGAYMPLDPDHPPERLAMMLDDADALLVLSQAPLAPRLPANRPVILLDEQTLAECTSAPASGATPANLAYVLYTSGSTGRPKGVAVEHRAVHNLAAALDATVYATLPDRPLRISLNGPLSFDTSVKQLVQLLRGHTLEIVPRDIRPDADALSAWLQERAIDVFDCTPSQLRLLLDAGLGAYPRCVLVGGEAIDPQLWQQLATNAERRCYNLYGPTECTVDTTTAPITGPRPTLGSPIPGAQLYVLDQAMRLVPAGVPGELYIGGAGVARGYYGRPNLTAERFVPNPFGVGGAGGEHQEPKMENQEPVGTTDASGNSKLNTQHSKLYRSGDLVRWLPDGTLEFLDRVDQQVKLRGHRIELSEIEAALRQHPDVQAAAVLLREDTPGDQRLVAYLVPSEEPRTENGEPGADNAELKTQTSKLKTLLQEQLPGYMVPSAYVWLGALPLNPNGKLDRRALPVPPSDQTSGQEAQLPRDQLELELVRAWEELLGVAPVGIHDDFFALGGHSLLAVRLAKRIEGIAGAPFPLAALLQGATVARTAARLREGRPIAASPLVALQPAGDRPPLFLVHPGGGGAFCYLPLAAALGQHQPLYAFQSPALAEAEPLPRDVPTLAASYVELMRQQQPDGPYRLGGWSFGGVVAFEMAQQIRAQGGEVALLALLDARLPDENSDPHDDLWLLIAFVQDLGLPLDQLDLADLGDRTPTELLALVLEQARRAQVIPEDLALDDLRRLLLIFKQHRTALDSYRPRAYSGTVMLFPAAQSGRYSPEDPTGGWGGLASDISSHPIDSDHFALVRPPHVQTVAATLAAALGHNPAAEAPA
ncbi:MAG TPA: amino acid adenylation domain-containing protein [Roseiflexaceae bacterium]|nr:amino acid adenylation domain-containing protein [Roseiflexaceae bacterium]